ncbi:MAG: NIPSNAP family protein [Verrucomicrobiales bacterium]
MTPSLIMFAADAPTGGKTSSEAPVYEMRTYYSPEGKLENLHNRFRNHTLSLFEKHGIKNVGYWTPIENKENKLIFLLEYPSREHRENAWKKFTSDPEWQKAQKESEANGPIVTNAQVVFLQTTDYSPKLKIDQKGNRIFELRTYTTPVGKLENLHARFRNHTVGLFKKHGIENVVYFTKMKDQPNADTMLIYFLAHKSQDAAKKSFDAFRTDADWVKAKGESEKDGSLTVPGGVKSEFLKPTDYSPLK